MSKAARCDKTISDCLSANPGNFRALNCGTKECRPGRVGENSGTWSRGDNMSSVTGSANGGERNLAICTGNSGLSGNHGDHGNSGPGSHGGNRNSLPGSITTGTATACIL